MDERPLGIVRAIADNAPHGLEGESRLALSKLIAVLAITAAAALSLPAAAYALTLAEEEFCTPGVLVDYEAPLASLPKVREPPESGKLPFAPPRLRFRPLSSQLVIAGDEIEFRMWLGGNAFGSKRLDLDVESRLVRIDRKGRDLRVSKRRVEHVARLYVGRGTRHDIGFGRSPRPGLYRYDILFRDSAGDLLGHVHEHYRVVRRSRDVRLRLNGTSFRPGDTVLGQLENYTPEYLRYGTPFWIEQFDGIGWSRLDLSDLFGREIAFTLIGLRLAPGAADDCSAGFSVPAGMSPGLYRLGKSVALGETSIDVITEFTVEASA